MLLPAAALGVVAVSLASYLTQSGLGRVTATGIAAVTLGFAAATVAMVGLGWWGRKITTLLGKVPDEIDTQRAREILDALIEVGRMAERIVGHALPSELLRAGSLDAFRRKQAA